MSIAERRAEVAASMTEALAEHDIVIDPYKPSSPAPFRGWLQVSQTDEDDATLAEVRLSVECQILVAVDRTDFEKVQDVLAGPLIRAARDAGGWSVVVQPFTETVSTTTLYALSARFYTFASIESEAA